MHVLVLHNIRRTAPVCLSCTTYLVRSNSGRHEKQEKQESRRLLFNFSILIAVTYHMYVLCLSAGLLYGGRPGTGRACLIGWFAVGLDCLSCASHLGLLRLISLANCEQTCCVPDLSIKGRHPLLLTDTDTFIATMTGDLCCSDRPLTSAAPLDHRRSLSPPRSCFTQALIAPAQCLPGGPSLSVSLVTEHSSRCTFVSCLSNINPKQ